MSIIDPTKDNTRPTGTLGALVEAQIEQDIVEGRFLPGDRLDEEELATRLSTSRTPIREALRKLAASGLVTIRPRSGATVSRPSLALVIDLFEVVSELEAFAARLAAQRATDTQLTAIQIAHEDCERLSQSSDAGAYFNANLVFHGAIWSASNNVMLAEQIGTVNKRLSPYRRQITFHPTRKQDSQSEHSQIANALANRKPDVAEKAMRDHVMILSDDALQLARTLRL
ncbi:GntR family transcriptional regulator [Pacificibacter marinus]|uniref:GntR family transcriptional regulator n=1 Tax=Pacificibacter marinus TaxID=658057 RepID=UPI001C064EB8|nr:GntR family transcriptional regulator [Pacificibacter marinus]MBU2866031.1 GntR family transcriptional regulator [Pacificibacter marinus]